VRDLSSTIARPGFPGGPFRALRHRNYRLYWFGQLVSQTGSWTQNVAQSWLVYRLTGSPTLLGLVGFASQAPVFAFSLLGGVAADRWDRRRLILLAQAVAMGQAALLAALTLLGKVNVGHVVVLAAVLGLAGAVDIPARQSFFIELAGREDLMNAVALNSSAFHAARMIGPALAALLIPVVGEGWCFLINGFSFLGVILALVLMKPSGRRATAPTRRWIAELGEGLAFAWKTPLVRRILILVATTGFWGISYTVLMPVFAGEVLHSGPGGLGFLMSASGLGSIAGALWVAARSSQEAAPARAAPIAGYGVALGLALVGFSLSPALGSPAVLAALCGFFMISQAAKANTAIQLLVPEELRGRVMSLYTAFFIGAVPFGSLASGSLAQIFGAPATVALAGVLTASVPALGLLSRKRLRSAFSAR
jgi:MFS family permease